jgi:hypothetical protein
MNTTPPETEAEFCARMLREADERLQQFQPVVEEDAEAGMEEEEQEDDGVVSAFPALAWRGSFKTYREAMQGTTEASDAYHFCSLWVASAVRLRRRIWFPYGIDLYPNVDIAIYGLTGDRKTTAARGAIRLLDNTSTKILQGSGSGEGLADWLNTEATISPPSHFTLSRRIERTAGAWQMGRRHTYPLFNVRV